MNAELNARRTAAAAVLADYRAELASAPLSKPPGRQWMLRLASVLDDLLTALTWDGDDEGLDSGEEDEEGQFRNRMACGDSLWDEEQYPEGAAMHCPRYGATSAITEEEWLADHPAEPIGFLVAEEADDEDGEDLDDGTEPYCADCGQWIGMFVGMDGWHHFRGDPAPGGQRELYDAGHEAAVAWCTPPGRAVSPADAAIVREALADAEWHRRQQAVLGGHRNQAEAYHRLAALFGGEQS